MSKYRIYTDTKHETIGTIQIKKIAEKLNEFRKQHKDAILTLAAAADRSDYDIKQIRFALKTINDRLAVIEDSLFSAGMLARRIPVDDAKKKTQNGAIKKAVKQAVRFKKRKGVKNGKG